MDSTAPLQFLALITMVPKTKRSFDISFGRPMGAAAFFNKSFVLGTPVISKACQRQSVRNFW